MTPFDLVIILLLANAVQNAMVGPDSSLTGGLIAAGVLIGVNYLLAVAKERLPWLRRVVEGSPTVLISGGHVFEENLRKEDVSNEELLMAMRDHGIESFDKVRLAVLEVNGAISIIPDEDGEAQSRPRRRRRFLRR